MSFIKSNVDPGGSLLVPSGPDYGAGFAKTAGPFTIESKMYTSCTGLIAKNTTTGYKMLSHTQPGALSKAIDCLVDLGPDKDTYVWAVGNKARFSEVLPKDLTKILDDRGINYNHNYLNPKNTNCDVTIDQNQITVNFRLKGKAHIVTLSW